MQGSPVTVSPATVSRVTASSSKRPLVIGLVGGIASGKSAVAQAFASLGCVVCDSDAQAKEALKQPEVRDQIVQWWGQDILNEQGDLDRAKIAAIVFHDADQRKKLEGLIHPLVHARRARQIEQMPDAPAFIIDAPLLLEAGVDKECDAVIFVDTPRAVRLRRAMQSRGWDEQEFDRREQAQLDLKTKRSRSDFEISNGADRAALGDRCADLLARIRATARNRGPYRGRQASEA